MDTVVRRFAARLHSLRIERNLTQEALGAKAKLHPGYISALERASKIPSLLTLEQLATGLDVDLATLVDLPAASGRKSDRVAEEIALVVRRMRRCDPDTARRVRQAVEGFTSSK